MLYAERLNKVFAINDEDANRYLDLGYNILDKTGAVLYEAVPNDIQILRNSFIKHTAEIKALKAEIERLKAVKPERKAKAKASDTVETDI